MKQLITNVIRSSVLLGVLALAAYGAISGEVCASLRYSCLQAGNPYSVCQAQYSWCMKQVPPI